MSTFNPVVNHVTDKTKRGGIIESYQYLPMEFQELDSEGNPTGGTITKMVRVNFVIWPGHPVPFVHEELSENLAFDNVYVGSIDEDDREESETNSEIVSLLEENYPEIAEQLRMEVNSDEVMDDEEEGDEVQDVEVVN